MIADWLALGGDSHLPVRWDSRVSGGPSAFRLEGNEKLLNMGVRLLKGLYRLGRWSVGKTRCGSEKTSAKFSSEE